MSKREKNQEYVLIPKRKLNALEKNCHFDPDLDTSVLELVDELPKQYKMKAKSLTKWILTNQKTFHFPVFFQTQRLKCNVACFPRIIFPYFFKNKSSFTNRNVWKYNLITYFLEMFTLSLQTF